MKGPHPWALIFLGVLITGLFLVVMTTQIETSEAYAAGKSNVDVYRPNWSIILQVPNLIQGQESSEEAMLTVIGWTPELLFLTFVTVGYEVASSAIGHGGQLLAALFGLGSLAIVGYNFWTDYQYGQIGGGVGGHILFAFLTAFVAAFFGILGPGLVVKGWKRA